MALHPETSRECLPALLDALRSARRAGFAAALVAALGASGASAQDLVYQADSEPDEFWDPSGRAQISGQILVGVMIGRLQGEVPQPATFASLVAGRDLLCLALVSQDGAYRFNQEYAPAGVAGQGIAALDFAPAHPEAFAADMRFALRLSLGSCTAGAEEVALVAASAADLAGGGEVGVLVNGLGADGVRFNLPEAGVRVDCAPVTGARATAFNFECAVPRGDVVTGMAIVERFRGSVMLDPVFFTLIVP